jgi:hypothetical protein
MVSIPISIGFAFGHQLESSSKSASTTAYTASLLTNLTVMLASEPRLSLNIVLAVWRPSWQCAHNAIMPGTKLSLEIAGTAQLVIYGNYQPHSQPGCLIKPYM